MKVERLIREAIREYDMLKPGQKVLVGFSGGADSICLLTVLHKLGYNTVAAHMNHSMRETAARDMEFCRDFCKRNNIPLEIKVMPERSLKSENSARLARYEFFREVMAKYGIERLATAHNKNDSAETVLLHLLRGAATDGLCGISPKEGMLIRPLIKVKKSEVIEFCRTNNISYMTDETNFSNVYSRNKLRNVILPLLEEEFNPALVDCIADNAIVVMKDSKYLEKCAQAEFERLFDNNGLDAEGLSALDAAIRARVIELLWKKCSGAGQNLSAKYIDAIEKLIKSGKSGAGADIPGGCKAVLEYGRLKIGKAAQKADYCMSIKPGKRCEIYEAGIAVTISESATGLKISLNGDETLTVRNRKAGDKFAPAGFCGRKKLSDYFTDKKVPRNVRDYLPVICADERIAAVADMRADAEFAPGVRKKDYYICIEEL